MILLLATILWAAQPPKLPPEAVCPAFWKCVGPKDTRDPDCKCWDRY